MKDKYFLDTNIFVYSFDSSDKIKSVRAKSLIADLLKNDSGIISNQVVQEFINVATKKFKMPMTVEDCKLYVEKIMLPMWEISANPTLILEALEIKQRWKYSFYDSLIIAAAIMTNCSILYSEDLQAGQRIDGVEILNPFETDSSERKN